MLKLFTICVSLSSCLGCYSFSSVEKSQADCTSVSGDRRSFAGKKDGKPCSVHVNDSTELAINDLVSELATAVPAGQQWRVAVGSFLFKDTKLSSSFSEQLRHDMGVCVSSCSQFAVITRDRIDELERESQFQNMD